VLGFNPVASFPVASIGTAYDVALTGQSLTLSLNSVTIPTVATAPSQSIALSLNSVSVTASAAYTLGSQSLTFTLNDVAVPNDIVVYVTGQRIYTGVTSVSLITGQTLSVTGQTIYTTLNGFRLWGTVDTTQPINCSGQVPSWNEIAFGDLIYGDIFAIAATPICSIEEAAPIRKNPPQTWGSIDTATTTTWDTVET